MEPVRLILVGGFLGAGKTTLLAQAAARLTARGRRVGLVTNDQVAGLVDTANLRERGFTVAEIPGGCFCCRYDGLVDAIGQLRSEGAEVVLAEPVGSCTDLSATVIQPLRQQLGQSLHIAPFTVVADAARLEELLRGSAADNLSADVAYIYRKQLEEADLILMNKLDLLDDAGAARLSSQAAHAFAPAEIRAASALVGQGVNEWLDLVLGERPAGRQIASIDYDIYAAGEATLGWLNVGVDLEARSEPRWETFATGLLEALRLQCFAASAEIAHVKAAIRLPGGALLASLTSSRSSATGASAGRPDRSAPRAHLLLNARAEMTCQDLDAAFERALSLACGSTVSASVTDRRAIRPARPVPVHRFTTVVPA